MSYVENYRQFSFLMGFRISNIVLKIHASGDAIFLMTFKVLLFYIKHAVVNISYLTR